jgi:Holliday junction resolvase RusA-like endonuclease
MQIEIVVEGVPIPQGSFKHIGNGRIIAANSKLNAWRDTIAKAASSQTDVRNYLGAVEVECVFIMPRPKSVKRESHTVKPDVDKLIRSCFDSISLSRYCQIIQDDSQITNVSAVKFYSETDFTGAIIRIYNI